MFKTLTNGSGFYLAKGKEILTEGRKIVLRNRDNGDFFDDFSSGTVKQGNYLLQCLVGNFF